MHYKEYIPSEALRKYIQCYYIYESDTDTVMEDNAFATGCVEVMFNLSGVQWETKANGAFAATPKVELWGQVLDPLSFRTAGKNCMLGIRFYPFSAAVFLQEDIQLFNDKILNLTDVLGKPIEELHSKLLETESLAKRIDCVEAFLLNRLLTAGKIDKITLVQQVMHELKQEDFFDNIENVASRYGISSRYLQKIFLQYTGLTPKLYSKINRFQNSLLLLSKENQSLTSIAYECGYFDQSHFIKEFRRFTGAVPSGYDFANTTVVLASPNK